MGAQERYAEREDGSLAVRLTQEEIDAAIDAGTLQYRPAAMHGNPWLRLLRREVEDLVRAQSGDRYLRERKARTEGVCRKLAAVLRL
jgi:hypothetical protein